ncbi:MAG: dioxygenase family protein, partial [Stenotrophomonas sp.]
MTRLPSLYISHGSPMTALHPGLVGVRLAELAAQLPRPRAIVMASAHWLTRQPVVGAHPKPPTIHVFGGFPQALFDLQYPAPGDPELAAEVARRLAAAGLAPAVDPTR